MSKDNVVPLRKPSKKKCPLCGKAAVEAYQPFCSKQCADRDLGKWLNGSYAVPTAEEPGEDEFQE